MADFRHSDSCVWSAVRLAFISSRGGASRVPTAAEAWSRKPSQRSDPTLFADSNICGHYVALGVHHMESDAPRSMSLLAIWRFFIPSTAAICEDDADADHRERDDHYDDNHLDDHREHDRDVQL